MLTSCSVTYRITTDMGVAELYRSYASTGLRIDEIMLMATEVDENAKAMLAKLYPQHIEHMCSWCPSFKGELPFKMVAGGHTMRALSKGQYRVTLDNYGGVWSICIPACVYTWDDCVVSTVQTACFLP